MSELPEAIKKELMARFKNAINTSQVETIISQLIKAVFSDSFMVIRINHKK
jgi:hypothetical protein